MITEAGTVVAVEERAVWVETIQRSTCNSCQAQQGCGQSLLSKMGAKSIYLRVLLNNTQKRDYRINDRVTLGIPENIIVRSSLIAYIIPLVLMLVFSGSAHNLWENEIVSLIAGISGLLVGGVFIYYYTLRHQNDTDHQAFIVDEELKPVKMVSGLNGNHEELV